MAIRVKICGVTTAEDALWAASVGAWAIGFNFFRESKRFVAPEVAAEIVARLPTGVETVGVFVNEPRASVESIRNTVGLSMVQFHGDESPEECRGWPVRTIKAIRVRSRQEAAKARRYAVDFILADAYVEGAFGGTGQSVDVSLLDGFERDRLLLAGGLTPESVAAAVSAVRPFAVDVASGVEATPGRKDPTKVRRFIENANAA